MKYVKAGHLEGGHTSGVAALAFSPNGKQVASAGLDSNLCIWNIADMRLIHNFRGASAILSLAWVPEEPGTLVCGSEDGSISVVDTSADTLHARTFPRSHRFPVEHLAYKNGLLASGAHEDVAIWSRGSDGRWTHLCDLDVPPVNSNNKDRDVLVTSLHWTRSPKHKSLLLVTYLYHGYILVKAGVWSRVFTIPLNGLIGSASVTPDGSRMIVSNMISGFDIYKTETGESSGTLTHPISKAFTVPVLFAHGGNAVIGGSPTGRVHLWDATALRMHQVLQHAGTYLPPLLCAFLADTTKNLIGFLPSPHTMTMLVTVS
ncbi:WD40 repeat-like protein [Lentinus brumalis]|uniref:WD40 repeat-like protein n=1 Tax=Lentinus brumalis TaxID=2498619 RepID=A0A371CJN6_9APHY|nr:WD40 repeat-like protein [Polyporus brumalis]